MQWSELRSKQFGSPTFVCQHGPRRVFGRLRCVSSFSIGKLVSVSMKLAKLRIFGLDVPFSRQGRLLQLVNHSVLETLLCFIFCLSHSFKAMVTLTFYILRAYSLFVHRYSRRPSKHPVRDTRLFRRASVVLLLVIPLSSFDLPGGR